MTSQERKWLATALTALEGTMSPMARVKILRTVGQLYSASADRIDCELVDKFEDRMYNTNIQTQGATHA